MEKETNDIPTNSCKALLYMAHETSATGPLLNSQAIPHLRAIASRAMVVVLVTFELDAPSSREERHRQQLSKQLAECSVTWEKLKRQNIHIPHLSGLIDSFLALPQLLRIIRRHNVGVVHARSMFPGLIAVALKWLYRLPFVNDPRNFHYEIAKCIERCASRWPKLIRLLDSFLIAFEIRVKL